MGGKELEAIISIVGKIDPSLQKSINEASKSTSGIGVAAKVASGVAIASFAAVGTAAIAAGKKLVDLASDFDTASDTIRIGTGATGDALKALESDFDEVYKSVPTTMEDASSAIADYNTRLGLTGPQLQNISKQAIEVSSMLGDDLSGVVESSSQAFTQWGISADKMGEAMDYTFKASQSTGVGFTELLNTVQQFGPQLQDMGYSFEEATALVGQLDKAGVNTSEVLAAMKKSVTTMAKEGISASDGLKKYVTQIQNAGTEAKAASIAAKVFGSRAGSTMAAAIRNGTLSVDDLTKSLQDSNETIGTAMEDTMDFPERLQLFKQNAQEALKPLANTLFDALNDAMPYVQQALDKLLPKLQEAADNIGPWIEDFVANTLPALADKVVTVAGAIADGVGWVFENWETVKTIAAIIAGIAAALVVLNTVMTIATAVQAAMAVSETAVLWPILLIVAAVAAVIAVIVLLVKHWDVVTAKAQQFVATIVSVFQSIGAFFAGIWANVTAVFQAAWNGIIAGFQFAVGILTGIGNTLMSAFGAVAGFIKGVFEGIIGAIKAPINGLIGLLNKMIAGLNKIQINVPDWVPAIGGKTLGFNIPAIPTFAKGGFTEGVSIAGEAGREAVISFDPAYRKENLSYWAQAGQMLGLGTFDDLVAKANGGTSVNLGGVNYNPKVVVEGNASEQDILNALRQDRDEFMDLLREIVAEAQEGRYAGSY